MTKVPEIFGSLVFNETVMKERLPKDVYKALQKHYKDGKPIDLKVAKCSCHCNERLGNRTWCYHFTHWFQPMTGITAENTIVL